MTPSAERRHGLINGEPGAVIDALDRGLHFGDGVFETVAVRQGELLLWERHLARLYAGCDRLAIPRPAGARLREEAQAVCGSAERAAVKIVVTRGVGGRGYRADPAGGPNRFVLGRPWPDYPDTWATEGVRARVCQLYLGHQPRLAGIKHLNRLEQVLARAEWSDPAIAEGLLLDRDGGVVEGTATNVFAVRGGIVYTPALDRCGVEGVMRAEVLETCARLGLRTVIDRLPLAALLDAEEVFLTNSLIGLWPIIDIDGRRYLKGIITADVRHELRHAIV